MNTARPSRTTALGLALAVLAPVAVHAQHAPRAAPSPSTVPAPRRACVQFVQQTAPDGQSVRFELTNRCNTPVESTVGWSVACGTRSEGVPVDHREALGPSEHRVFEATGAACGSASWRVDDVHWSWHAQQGDSASR